MHPDPTEPFIVTELAHDHPPTTILDQCLVLSADHVAGMKLDPLISDF